MIQVVITPLTQQVVMAVVHTGVVLLAQNRMHLLMLTAVVAVVLDQVHTVHAQVLTAL